MGTGCKLSRLWLEGSLSCYPSPIPLGIAYRFRRAAENHGLLIEVNLTYIHMAIANLI